jgi:hypothetical protein
MSTDNNNNGAAAPHPLELALLGLIAAALALRTLLAALLALVLTLAGWRPRADAQIRPMAEQMHQLPMAATAAALAGAEPLQPTAQAPAAEPIPAPVRPSPSPTVAAALAQLPMAELRAACAAAGCRPGRSRASAMAALLAAAEAAG